MADAGDELSIEQKLNAIIRMQTTSLARTLVLQDAIVTLARVLALGAPEPKAAMTFFIRAMTEHHQSRAEMQPHAYDALSFDIGANFEALITALRSAIPGVEDETPRN